MGSCEKAGKGISSYMCKEEGVETRIYLGLFWGHLTMIYPPHLPSLYTHCIYIYNVNLSISFLNASETCNLMLPVSGSRAGEVLQQNCGKSKEFQGCVSSGLESTASLSPWHRWSISGGLKTYTRWISRGTLSVTVRSIHCLFLLIFLTCCTWTSSSWVTPR